MLADTICWAPYVRVRVQRSFQNSQNQAHDLFFLAMSYQQLGKPAKARQYYDRAMRWWHSQGTLTPSDEVEELNAFRAEAAALLKIVSKPSL
jgi:hypothetical protein